MSEILSIQVVDHEHEHIVQLSGELDLAGVDELKEVLAEVGRSTVTVDLERLSFIDSSGIGALLMAKRGIEAEGNHCRIVNAGGAVRRVFELSGLSEILC